LPVAMVRHMAGFVESQGRSEAHEMQSARVTVEQSVRADGSGPGSGLESGLGAGLGFELRSRRPP